MAKLHLIGGEKGGVGKSFVARTLAQYCLDHDIPVTLYDTDRSNPDLKRIYGDVADVHLAIFSEGAQYEDTANSIYNSAIAQTTLVNLPAQVMPSLRLFITNNELFELAKEDGVEFVVWFVVDGGYDSLSLLGKSLKFFGKEAQHIVLKNHGTGGDDWEALETDEALQSLIEQYCAVVIDVPRFVGSSTRNTIDRENLTFGEARESNALGSSIGRQRVKRYLRESYQAIEASGVFDGVLNDDQAVSA